jgi:hypothetical protein
MPPQDAIEHLSSNAVNPNFQPFLECTDTQRMAENMLYNEMSGTL